MNQRALEPTLPTRAIVPGSWRAWLLASRPATLTAAVAPVLVGTAIAKHEGEVRLVPFVATLVGAGFLQIASNFANDVFDHEKGADTEHRLGPTRAVQAGLISPREMKWGLGVTLTAAFLVGLYLMWIAGWPIVAIGLFSMVSAVAYTGGPYPLGYHGLGDVFVMLFFGFAAVCGTSFVHLGHVPPVAWWGALAVGALITNILVVNNLRDRETDAQAGKKTLAVRYGRKGAEIQYMGLCAVAYGIPGLMIGAYGLAWWTALPWLTFPLALKNVRGVLREEGRALNPLLGASAKLVFLFGVLFALGIHLSA